MSEIRQRLIGARLLIADDTTNAGPDKSASVLSSNLPEVIRIVLKPDAIRYFHNRPLAGVAKCSGLLILSGTESATIATHSQVDYNNRLSVRTVY
ncbi:hypothetical protein FEK41_16115 [Escherichia sp. E4694]|nr:hypothetical protein FEK41_16115 [Escherichia sp. E4694]